MVTGRPGRGRAFGYAAAAVLALALAGVIAWRLRAGFDNVDPLSASVALVAPGRQLLRRATATADSHYW